MAGNIKRNIDKIKLREFIKEWIKDYTSLAYIDPSKIDFVYSDNVITINAEIGTEKLKVGEIVKSDGYYELTFLGYEIAFKEKTFEVMFQ